MPLKSKKQSLRYKFKLDLNIGLRGEEDRNLKAGRPYPIFKMQFIHNRLMQKVPYRIEEAVFAMWMRRKKIKKIKDLVIELDSEIFVFTDIVG